MLKTRVLSALIMVPVALACAWAGSPVFDVAVALVGLVMAHEWQAIVQPGHRSPGWVAGAAAVVVALLAVPHPEIALVLMGVAIGPVWGLARGGLARGGRPLVRSTWRFPYWRWYGCVSTADYRR